MYSYGPPHMAVQKQDDQHKHTFSSYVRIRDVVLKTYLGRWMIGRSGERGSGISVLPARDDDDDDDDDDMYVYKYIKWLFIYKVIVYIYIYIYIYTYVYVSMCEERVREREKERGREGEIILEHIYLFSKKLILFLTKYAWKKNINNI